MKLINKSLLVVLSGFGSALCLLFSNSMLLETTAQRKSKAPTELTAHDEFLSSLEQQVLSEINLARTRPAQYAAYLEQIKPLYSDKTLTLPGRGALLTVEGLSAVDEAIRFLRSSPPLPPLQISRGMCSGSGALVKEQGASGMTGHKSADGRYCEQRVAQFGTYKEPIGETLTYGNDSARQRVISLLIDDGVKNRGHRQRIFTPDYKVAGVACGEHSTLGSMCVITFAAGFTDKPDGKRAGSSSKLTTNTGFKQF